MPFARTRVWKEDFNYKIIARPYLALESAFYLHLEIILFVCFKAMIVRPPRGLCSLACSMMTHTTAILFLPWPFNVFIEFILT